ncbi:MAG TPA: ABC transporter permease [Chitinophagaceae bacterium]|nr:ABC transporter permease [Chitinophagaceae bacterium]
MFKNYLKTAWRNLWKNKAFSAINIIGLSVGMAACIIIMLFVTYEKSFDNFQTKNIYRLNEVQKFPGMVASQKVGLSMFPMGPTMKNEFPQILNYSRIHWMFNYPLKNNDKTVFFPAMFYVDSTFLQMFDFKLLRGNRADVLQKPNSIVLTEASAEKLFGKEDPIGKSITHYSDDTVTYKVTGIMANVPQNSQMQFDGLMSLSTFARPEMMDWWGGNWMDTYFELAPNTNIAEMTKKFPGYLKKHLHGDGYKYYELFLLPLKEIHAGASDIGLDYINYQKFDKNYTNIFSAIALIVLVIACVNFMNLSTARSAERAREVGIRKSIGALRLQLSLQFIGETVLLAFIALVFAIALVEAALPYVNNLSQRSLHLPLSFANGTLMYIIGGTLLVGILSGLYPAAYLSSFQPVKVLKGSIQTGKNKGMLRNFLVVSQFASAIFLMIATIFVVRQLNYMQDKDPGFVRDQVVTVPLDNITTQKYDLFRKELLTSNLINGVTAAQDQLGSHLDQSGVHFRADGPSRDLAVTQLVVDPGYLDLYKMKLVAGRNFSKEKSQANREYILNEGLAKELLKDHPGKDMNWLLGKEFGYDSLGTIIGVVKDFNFNSLHNKIENMFLFNQGYNGYFRTASIKIKAGKTPQTLAFIKSTWAKIFNDHPFEYQFLDDHFNDVYRADIQVSSIVGILAGLAIVISCLGLFGLASYSAERRVKEVGIRKVMGASVQSIVSLLSRQFVILVLIAIIIAWPAAYFTMTAWLQDYAYRINISWWVFIIAGIAALLIALITVSYQAIRAAIANPVKSLRTE